MRRIWDTFFTTLCVLFLGAVAAGYCYSLYLKTETMPTPTLNRSFQSGLVFALTEHGMIPVQVGSDFDVTRKTLDEMLGGSVGAGSAPWIPMNPILTNGRVWQVRNERQFDRVFQTFFRHYKAPNEVRHKPAISGMALIPIDMDKPFLAGDFTEPQQ